MSAEQLIEAYKRAPVVVASYTERLLLAPFDRFDAVPPGVCDGRVFDQGMYWVDLLRRPYVINDPASFHDDLLERTLVLLTENLMNFFQLYLDQFPWRTVPSDPIRWLESRMLFEAITIEHAKRALDLPL